MSISTFPIPTMLTIHNPVLVETGINTEHILDSGEERNRLSQDSDEESIESIDLDN